MACINRLNDSYVSIRALHEALGLSRAGILGLIKQGKMPGGLKIGKSRRWAVSEIQAWLEQQAREGETA